MQEELSGPLGYCIHRPERGTVRLSFTLPVILPGISGHHTNNGEYFPIFEGNASAEAKEHYSFIIQLCNGLKDAHRDLCLLTLDCLLTVDDLVSPYDLIITHGLAAREDVMDDKLHDLIIECWGDRGRVTTT